MVFIGGAVLAEVMRDKPQFWLSREQYLEMGIERLIQMKYGGGPKNSNDNNHD